MTTLDNEPWKRITQDHEPWNRVTFCHVNPRGTYFVSTWSDFSTPPEQAQA